MKKNKDIVIGLDFDGTVVKHEYPDIGEPVPNAIEVLQIFQTQGYKIVLNTMRSGQSLDEAVAYLVANGINLYGINENPTQKNWTSSPKVYATFYIDDAAIGCPLIDNHATKRPYVDWVEVKRIVDEKFQ